MFINWPSPFLLSFYVLKIDIMPFLHMLFKKYVLQAFFVPCDAYCMSYEYFGQHCQPWSSPGLELEPRCPSIHSFFPILSHAWLTVEQTLKEIKQAVQT